MVSSERVAHGAVIRKSLRHLKLAADTPPHHACPFSPRNFRLGGLNSASRVTSEATYAPWRCASHL
jgi:hypothetical protein